MATYPAEIGDEVVSANRTAPSSTTVTVATPHPFGSR